MVYLVLYHLYNKETEVEQAPFLVGHQMLPMEGSLFLHLWLLTDTCQPKRI